MAADKPVLERRRKGWIQRRATVNSEWGEWETVNPDEPDRTPPAAVDAADRTPEEMLAEVLRLTNRQLAGLTLIAQSAQLDDLQLAQLGQVQRLILGHMRTNPAGDPMEQRDGESDAEYLERLETMKRSAK